MSIKSSILVRPFITHFIIFIIISPLLALPVFAQTAKSKPASKAAIGKTQSQQGAMLTPENLEKESYRLWLECFQAWQQGKKPDVPNLGILNNVDPKEAQHAHAVWDRSKFRAFLAVAEKEMYQECLNWWRAKEQGQQIPPPVLRYPDVFD